ncbi:MAG: phosphoglucomutase/phosphomannomutase family protein, partial [Candidatus Omnitrophota bacterium]
MVTASHNPARYNGIKYKGYFGGSVGKDVTDEIESRLYARKVRFIDRNEAKRKGLIRIKDIIPTHIKHVKKYADMKLLKKSRLRILIDSMNGTGANYIEEVLRHTNNKVTTINGSRDPYFGGRSPEPNEVFLRSTARAVKKGHYDIAIVTDGDGDRLGVILSNGKVISGHKVMTLLLLHFLEDRSLTGGVVQTICGTALIDKICRNYGLKTYKTAVGFKYIAEVINKEDILVGGEETGGVAFKGWLPERDGILSGLLILEMMAYRKKNLMKILENIKRDYGVYVYKRLDLRFSKEKKKKLLSSLRRKPFSKVLGKNIVDVKAYDGFKFIREDGSWFMLRSSGTEPKLRIYSEAHSEKEALRLVEFGKQFALGI